MNNIDRGRRESVGRGEQMERRNIIVKDEEIKKK